MTAREIAEKWFRCDRPGPCRQEGITTPAHERIHVEGVDRLTAEITEAVVAGQQTALRLAAAQAQFVLVRPDGRYWHASLACPMVDALEYRLVTRDQATASFKPCACAGIPA